MKTLTKKLIFENAWLKFWEDDVVLPNGEERKYAYLEGFDGTLVIARDREGKLLILREWRYPIRDWTWCFPAGGVEKGATSLETAKRELLEETGYAAQIWTELGTLRIDPGRNCQTVTVYLAEDVEKVQEPELEPTEQHETHWFSLDEIEEMIRKGEISNGWLLAGLSMLRAHAKNSEQ